jgi:predicted protein tyrosine phosphatase
MEEKPVVLEDEKGRGTEGREPSLPILVLSRDEVERYEPESDSEVCISITGTLGVHAELSPRFREVLRLSFADEITSADAEGRALFGEEHAREVLDFATRHRGADGIVIHCHAGESRSPGMALGLMDAFGVQATERDLQRWGAHNSLVRSTIARVAAGKRAGAPEGLQA